MKSLVMFVLVLLFAAPWCYGQGIETVPVGNPGNAGELSGGSAGGYGDDAIVGSVSYKYNIGKYEVTAGQYTNFLNAVAPAGQHDLYDTWMMSDRGSKIQRAGSLGNYTYSVAADWANRPVNGVSWYDAARFSNWLTTGDTETGVYTFGGTYTVTNILDHETAALTLGKTAWFLPTEDEWYKATYHKNDGATGNFWDYATATNSVPSNDLINPDPGNNANFAPSSGDLTIDSPYYRTKVGEFENSRSPYGTFDQGGNLAEWNETLIGSSRGLRGGAWSSNSSSLEASYRERQSPTNEHDSWGFRVASVPIVPEPSSFVIFATGGIVLAGWRRRRKR
jgi:formylglycine-generating enzyme